MKLQKNETVRYALNGVFATGVHYFSLLLCIYFLEFQSVGLANLSASIIGVLTSFAGNKYFVFETSKNLTGKEAVKFSFFYILIALIHGVFMYQWTDVLDNNYNCGFIMAVGIQFLLGYLANKSFVFVKNSKEEIKYE